MGEAVERVVLGGIKYYVRPGTSDWNTVAACGNEHDEYGLLADGFRRGTLVFDLGAHIGGFAVAAAVAGANVVAVEPVPNNAVLIRRNATANGVGEFVRVEEAVMGEPGTARINYGYTHDENATHHAYIGSTSHEHPDASSRIVPSITLTYLATKYGTPAVIKMDCEGGEWTALADVVAWECPLIVGEWHPTEGHVRSEVDLLLGGTHVITYTGPEAGPGGFHAVKRATRLQAA